MHSQCSKACKSCKTMKHSTHRRPRDDLNLLQVRGSSILHSHSIEFSETRLQHSFAMYSRTIALRRADEDPMSNTGVSESGRSERHLLSFLYIAIPNVTKRKTDGGRKPGYYARRHLDRGLRDKVSSQ